MFILINTAFLFLQALTDMFGGEEAEGLKDSESQRSVGFLCVNHLSHSGAFGACWSSELTGELREILAAGYISRFLRATSGLRPPALELSLEWILISLTKWQTRVLHKTISHQP